MLANAIIILFMLGMTCYCVYLAFQLDEANKTISHLNRKVRRADHKIREQKYLLDHAVFTNSSPRTALHLVSEGTYDPDDGLNDYRDFGILRGEE